MQTLKLKLKLLFPSHVVTYIQYICICSTLGMIMLDAMHLQCAEEGFTTKRPPQAEEKDTNVT